MKTSRGAIRADRRGPRSTAGPRTITTPPSPRSSTAARRSCARAPRRATGQPMQARCIKVCQQGGRCQSEQARRGARRSSSRTSARSASRRSARRTASSPATTSRSSRACASRPRATTIRSIASRRVCCRRADGGRGAAATARRKARKRKLVAFYDRAAIDDGVLAGRNLEICWLKDPIDSFFIHIQGSVRVLLDDGKLMRLNYAGRERPSLLRGRPLADRAQDRLQRRNVDGPHPRMDGAQSERGQGAAAQEQVLRVLPRDRSVRTTRSRSARRAFR